MQLSQLSQLPFFNDPTEIYARLVELGDAVILDSGGDEQRGRWDILAAAPDPRFGLFLEPELDTHTLRSELASWRRNAARLCAQPSVAEAPFQGGFIGHFSYELGRRLQGLEPAAQASLPLAVARYYPWAIVQDRQNKRCQLLGDVSASPGLYEDLVQRLSPGWTASSTRSPMTLLQPFQATWDFSTYSSAFTAVKRYIRAGDCYQINLAQRFSAPYQGDLLEAYRMLRDVARAPFSAYLPLTADQPLLSLSPERFVTVHNGQVETRPIKGTRPRYADPVLDRQAAAELSASEKERAENLMIVDLLRNDLGRYCKPGSVQVDSLFGLESYATVHHLVSVVRGELLAGVCPLELLLGCLPGGSITGAPKYRAMQIIDELEELARQAWCGTIFYYSRHGRLDSNINIRTLYPEHGQLHCWAGGGLVDDSVAEAEFQEQVDKVGAFLRALEANFIEPRRGGA